MEVLVVLLIASVAVAVTFLAAFLWAVRTDQFDDLETPAVRMLFEHSDTREKSGNETNNAGSKAV